MRHQERTPLSKFVSFWSVETGLIAAGMIVWLIIIGMAHSPGSSCPIGEFAVWGLRPSVAPTDPAEWKILSEYQSSAPENAWQE